MNPDQFFDLFEVISFPVYYPEIDIFAYYQTDYPFIALSKNRQSYILLSTYEVLKCRTGPISICSPETAIWQSPYRNCEYALFLGLDATVAQLCDKRLRTTHPPVFRRLDQVGTWIYSTAKPLSLVVECPRLAKSVVQSHIIKLVGTNILNLPNSCTGHLPGIKLTAHFQQRSTLKLSTKTHLVFPIVTDILNKSEIDLIRDFNNYTSRTADAESSSTDLSLDTASSTLLNIQTKVKKLKESLVKEQVGAPRDYFREITSGTTSLLIIAIIIILVLIRKRLRCACIDHRYREAPSREGIEVSDSNVPPERVLQPEVLELTQSSSTQESPTKGDGNEQKPHPSMQVTGETPLRI